MSSSTLHHHTHGENDSYKHHRRPRWLSKRRSRDLRYSGASYEIDLSKKNAAALEKLALAVH